MIRVEPFKAEHLDELRVHPAQLSTLSRDDSPEYRQQLAAGLSFTGRLDGEILVCGGVLDLYDDRRIGHLWSVLGESAHRHFLPMHRATTRFLQTTGKRLLIASCEVGAATPCRWLRLLGFKYDHTDGNFGPAAATHAIYVRYL